MIKQGYNGIEIHEVLIITQQRKNSFTGVAAK